MLGPEAFGLVDDNVSEVSSQSKREQMTQKVPEAPYYIKPPQKRERAVPMKNKIKRFWEASPGKDLRQENTLKNKTNRQSR